MYTICTAEKLIIKLSIPTIISMVVTGLYNTADTFFVGRISTEDTAAVGLVFAAMAIIQAFGFLCGQGSGTYLSQKLGAGEKKEAEEMAATGLLVSVILGIILAVVGAALLAAGIIIKKKFRIALIIAGAVMLAIGGTMVLLTMYFAWAVANDAPAVY